MNADLGMPRLRKVAAAALAAGDGEQRAFEAAVDALACAFEDASEGARRGALLVASEDAGSATALQFWRDALATGPALASPGAFPWCLANAPCGALARRFGIVGPSATWLGALGGRGDAPAATLTIPSAWWLDHLAACAPCDDENPHAWIVALRFGGAGRVQVWHWQAVRPLPSGAAIDIAAAAMGEAMAHDWRNTTLPLSR